MKIVIIPGLTLPSVSDADLERIKLAGQTDDVVVASHESAHNEVTDADVIFGFVPKSMFTNCQQLRWVHAIASGVDGYMYPEFQNSPVVLTSEKGLVGSHLADHAFGLLLMLTRQLKAALLYGADSWNHRPEMRYQEVELTGMTLGILGFGGTGKAMAKRAIGFGMSVEAVDSEPVDATEEVPEVKGPDYWHEVLRIADVVAVCCPLTPLTRGLLNADAFALMKNTAFLVNVTRGEVMVEEDLVTALETGQIRGAALDVVPREPLPEDSVLWTLPNVIMSPHTAGASQFRASRNMDRFVHNLTAFVERDSTDQFEGIIDKYKGF